MIRTIPRTIALVSLLAAFVAGGFAVHAAEAQAPGAHHGHPAAMPSTAIQVAGAVARPMSLDLAALQALPVSTATLGGRVYTGIDLWTLLNTVTGLAPDPQRRGASLSMAVVASGTDGYRAVLSLGELAPDFGNRTVLVAYRVDGAPLGDKGLARLIVIGDGKPGRSVSNLTRIEVLNLPAP